MAEALFFSFALFVILGVPIAVALGLAGLVAMTFFGHVPLMMAVQKVFSGVDSFTLMAIPFFILAGNIMSAGGVSSRLVDLAGTFLGRASGGLALVSTAACTFFGAISGSAPATTAAIGSIMIKPMVERGYSRPFAAATVAASGTIGLLIPPSITAVIYGVIANVSIAKLFMGGVVPGLIMAVALMGVEYVISKKRGYHGQEPVSMAKMIQALNRAILALFMPVIILGGIYGGVFTPTEAAVVAVVYGLIVGLYVYKELDYKTTVKVFLSSAKSTAVIMYLVATAHIFSYILASEEIPQKITSAMLGISSDPIVVLMLINLALLVVGTFLDNAVAMVLLTPIFYPVISSIGIDPVFFGVIMVLGLAIGQITPPVGLCLFVACDIGKVTIEEISKEVVPWLFVLILVLILVTFSPGMVMWIPNAMM